MRRATLRMLVKKGIRTLGIAECSVPPKNRAVLCGVVMRGDFLIDGIAIAPVTLWGIDATDAFFSIWNKLKREDIQVIMLRGVIVSYYNIFDIERIYERTKTPVIGMIFHSRKKDVRDFLSSLPEGRERIRILDTLGEPVPLYLKTGHKIYAYLKNIEQTAAEDIINRFLVFGKLPEPVRVARLFGHAVLNIDAAHGF
ncbi:MAG: DUF99 family protein [Candidatus Korarchaeota archaeon]